MLPIGAPTGSAVAAPPDSPLRALIYMYTYNYMYIYLHTYIKNICTCIYTYTYISRIYVYRI